MKKIIAMIFSLTFLSSMAYGLTYEVKAGMSPDFLDNDGVYFNMGLDVYGEAKSIIQPGLGIRFAQFSADAVAGKVDAGVSTTLDKLPVFGIAKFNLLEMGGPVFYLKGFGGWQFINKDYIKSTGGLYYGYGAGFDISRVSIEYFITKETYELQTGQTYNGSFATIGLGFKF